MDFARLGGPVFHYADMGPHEAPALVFANSLGTDFRIWQDLHQHLGHDYRCVFYDKRGHGLSDLTAATDIAGHAADLALLLDRLDVDQAVVIGLSVGGMIAQSLAAARPERLRGLVLCDTGHRIGPPQMWDTRMAAIREGGLAALADAILERWFSVDYPTRQPEALAGWRNMLLRTPAEGYLAVCQAIRDADLTAEAQSIRLPTLCLVGDEDGATPPELVRALAKLLPDARYEVIAGAGHLPCLEKAAEMAALIRPFLKEIGHVRDL